ncbi:MAG: RidA family protein [Betaproteobacteria bacterium]|nr:RidA family protein [Betaproteobacteria bacterium]
MKKTLLNPEGIYKHPGFTRLISIEGPMKIVFVAGQTASDENYKCVAPGDMRAQYLKVMENLDLQLKAAGATWEDVVYKRTFTLDVDAYLKVSKDPATRKFFNSEKMPGSTLIGVTRLSDPEYLIEIDLVAAINP